MTWRADATVAAIAYRAPMPDARPELQAILAATRQTIRRQLSLLGLFRSLALAGGLLWLLDGWDVLYFQLTKLEQPRVLRALLIGSAVVGLVGYAVWWLVTRRLRPMPDDAVALTIERARPELQQRLITAVQSQQPDSGIAAEMSARTQRDAADALANFSPSDLIDSRPLRRAALLAAVLWGAATLTPLLAESHWSRWADAYLRLMPDYWSDFRQTRARLQVVRSPGEPPIEFDQSRTIRAARGANLTVVAVIADGTVRPDRVRLTATSQSDRRDVQTISMLPTDGGVFRHTLPRLFDDLTLDLVAGDYATAQPYRVEVVDPPQIDALAMAIDYPDYTGLDIADAAPTPVLSSRVELPVGSQVRFLAEANKPIATARLLAGETRLAQPAGGADFGFDAVIAAAGEPSSGGLVISEPTELELSLVDTDGLRSLAPLSLVIEPVADTPPQVSARPRGIGQAVTRRAIIPWVGQVTDDYGLRDAWLKLRIDEAEPVRSPVDLPTRSKSWTIDPDAPATIDLRDFDPQREQTLSLSLVAADANPAADARTGQSEVVTLQVVSADELLAILRGKELNLRQRFESIVEEVTDTRDDIREQRSREDEAAALPDSPEQMKLRQQISAGIDRDLLAVRKNASEAGAIFELFGDLRAEMVNNRVDTRDLLDRIDRGVLTPLESVLASDLPRVDRSMVAAREAIRSRDDIASSLAAADRDLSRLVDRLQAILAEMQRRQSYNELIEELQELTRRYEKLTEETKSRGVDDFFDDLLE